MSATRTVLRGLPLVPAVLLLVLFLAGPLVYCVVTAFTDMALTGRATTGFVGFDNFTTALGSPAFLNSLVVTLVFTVVSAVLGQNLLGLAIAVGLRAAGRVVGVLVRSVVVVAWVLPEVVAAYVLYAFFRDEGSLNAVLDLVGLGGPDWLFAAPVLAISVANIWRGTAFSMMVYSAALAGVDREVLEAATVDGAGRVRRFWHVTLPMIRRSITTNLMLITLQTLSVFGLVYVMTRGGPANRTQTLPIYMYEQAFQHSQIGYGTAIALMLLLVGALFAGVYLRAMRDEL